MNFFLSSWFLRTTKYTLFSKCLSCGISFCDPDPTLRERQRAQLVLIFFYVGTHFSTKLLGLIHPSRSQSIAFNILLENIYLIFEKLNLLCVAAHLRGMRPTSSLEQRHPNESMKNLKL